MYVFLSNKSDIEVEIYQIPMIMQEGRGCASALGGIYYVPMLSWVCLVLYDILVSCPFVELVVEIPVYLIKRFEYG